MKICTKCKELKNKEYFGRDKRHKDGLQSHCKKCQYELYGKKMLKSERWKAYIKKYKETYCKLDKYKKSLKAYRKTDKGILVSRLRNIKGRCYIKTFSEYKNYGGRGIKVCDEWLNNTESFYKWALDNKFKKELQIDRIDNNGNYSPENCRLVTPKENCYNTRKNVTDLKNKTRICKRCKKNISLKDFPRHKGYPFDKDYFCRNCIKEERKKYY